MWRRYAEDPVAREMMRQHAETCRVDKEDLKTEARALRSSLDEKHGENQKELSAIKRLIYLAVGAALGLTWLQQHGGKILEVLATGGH